MLGIVLFTFSPLTALTDAGVFLLFAFIYPGQHLPLAFLGWRLDTQKLRNEMRSLPPGYTQAIEECFDGAVNNTRLRRWV
jgi:hypothetical protein